MAPQDMTVLHDPDNGAIGDCDRACIATLLDLPVESVPHFIGDHYHDADDGAWWHARHAWLVDRGYVAVPTHPQDLAGWLPRRELDHLIAVGNSPRGTVHGVVATPDGEMVHDPHPSRDGLLDVVEYEVFVTVETWQYLTEEAVQGAAHA